MKPKHNYLIIDKLTGQCWLYGSVLAATKHIDNPLELTRDGWYNELRKRKKQDLPPYPFEHSGCKVMKLWCMSINDVEEDNPPLQKPKSKQ